MVVAWKNLDIYAGRCHSNFLVTAGEGLRLNGIGFRSWDHPLYVVLVFDALRGYLFSFNTFAAAAMLNQALLQCRCRRLNY